MIFLVVRTEIVTHNILSKDIQILEIFFLWVLADIWVTKILLKDSKQQLQKRHFHKKIYAAYASNERGSHYKMALYHIPG